MNSLYKLIIFFPFFIIGCSPNVNEGNKILKKIDSLNMNIFSKKGDKIYIFSDGYADQFGGLKGKKFMYRQFKETLLNTVNESMETQKQLLDQKIEAWKGSYSQVDDIVIFGVEVD